MILMTTEQILRGTPKPASVRFSEPSEKGLKEWQKQLLLDSGWRPTDGGAA